MEEVVSTLKITDYIIEFFIAKGITDVFGYPGGMVTHLMDSFSKYEKNINAHTCYHEQAASFAACGYAQVALKPGAAYATSGPGATNLITGICNAFFDSVPVIFITGQVNIYEGKGKLPLRQKGFQETDVCSLVSSITKYCEYIEKPEDIKYHLEKAYHLAVSGRPGPVLLDIPMNIQRAEIDPKTLNGFNINEAITEKINFSSSIERILAELKGAKRPLIIAGAGIQTSGTTKFFQEWIQKTKIPVVSSMLAVDALPESDYYFGFIGAYGARHANFILAKADLVISIGSRLDVRQMGSNSDGFASNAKLLRIDIDSAELENKIKEDEIALCSDLKDLLPQLAGRHNINNQNDFSDWLSVCNAIKEKLAQFDDKEPNYYVRKLSEMIEKDAVITTDVGQNQVWIAQSFRASGQRILFSGGHGAMGYSLPAAIGAYYASKRKVYAFMGDGGLQMNIQELQFIAREQLPIKIILFNNASLGMIRHFQEMYFNLNYVQTKAGGGYTVPDFGEIAKAYKLPYQKFTSLLEINADNHFFTDDNPAFFEIAFQGDTYVFPKLAINQPVYNQDPELDNHIYEYIMNL